MAELLAAAAELCAERRRGRERSERLRRERNSRRAAESAGELGEDRQVDVEPNPIQSTDAERE